MSRKVVLGTLAATMAVGLPAFAFFSLTSGNSTATFSAGNISVTSASGAAISGTAIDVSWVAPASNPTGTQYKVFRDSGSTPICTLTSSPCHDTGLVAGSSHSYTVSAVLGTNWVSPTPATTGNVPTLSPVSAPTITGLKDAASDTGTSATDGITKNQKPTIVGTYAANGATITVYDGVTSLGTTTVASGAWQFTPSSNLSEGAHTITATATVSGNTSSSSGSLNFTIDITAPSTPTASFGDKQHPANDVITGTAEASAIINISESAPTTAAYTGAAQSDGSFSVTVDDINGNSQHPVSVAYSVTAKDAAGNISAPTSVTGSDIK
jgi:hypothetical protein